MKHRLLGLIAGIIIGTSITGGIVLAKNGTEIINAMYNNIKIYVDGVKIEPTDATGTPVEPFVYNGTTYLPVRAIGEAIGKEVRWESSTQSVHIGERPKKETFLTDVCPPYETDWCDTSNSFKMAGEAYSNGIECWGYNSVSLFNLGGEYSQLECVVGHTARDDREKSVTFIVDGHTVKTFILEPESLPRRITVPLNHGQQLKIIADANTSSISALGIGNITVK